MQGTILLTTNSLHKQSLCTLFLLKGLKGEAIGLSLNV